MRYVITGTGRCGTGYMSKILTASGIPCGHENVYDVRGIFERPDLEADSSWLAVPHIPDMHNLGIMEVVHIVRNPLLVIRSWITSARPALMSDIDGLKNPYNMYLRLHYPEVEKYTDPVDRVLLYYRLCNQRIHKLCRKSKMREIFFRIEDNPSNLIKHLGGNPTDCYQYMSYNCGKNTNSISQQEVFDMVVHSQMFPHVRHLFIQYYPQIFTTGEYKII